MEDEQIQGSFGTHCGTPNQTTVGIRDHVVMMKRIAQEKQWWT